MKFTDENVRSGFIGLLKKIGNMVELKAKELCPADTGNLRSKIGNRVIPEDLAVKIGTNVPYAPYVEYMYPLESPGPGRETGQMPFLRPAIFQSMENIKKLIKDKFKA